jgi:lantibiotic modifying enzyme
LQDLVEVCLDELMRSLDRTGSISQLLHIASLRQALNADMQNIIRQTEHARVTDQLDGRGKRQYSSDQFLSAVVFQRKKSLFSFITRLCRVIEFYLKTENVPVAKNSVRLEFLNGDSHNKAERPVRIRVHEKDFVIKFTDPRTYIVHREVLLSLELGLGIRLAPPASVYDLSYEWQILPFIERGSAAQNIDSEQIFMYRLGALSASAYFLQMTDLHAENVIVSDGIPFIIDTECMFYSFYPLQKMTAEDRLKSTGLVAAASELSGIVGGDYPVKRLGAVEVKGRIQYLADAQNHRNNRLIRENGSAVSSREYSAEITEGFTDALRHLAAVKTALCQKIADIAVSGMRTRFLIRYTSHYLAMLEILRCPECDGMERKLGQTTRDFCNSAGFSTSQINSAANRFELLDLLGGDIPFFWADGQFSNLNHWSGTVLKLSSSDAFHSRVRRVMESADLTEAQLQALANIFTKLISHDNHGARLPLSAHESKS